MDESKDQTYFLASVPQQALQRVHFPLGALTKAQVRKLAEQLHLPSAARRSSAGICFIGAGTGILLWTSSRSALPGTMLLDGHTAQPTDQQGPQHLIHTISPTWAKSLVHHLSMGLRQLGQVLVTRTDAKVTAWGP